MTGRISKICLMAGIALFFTLVVFNNTTDYNSNFQFVRHVLMMDTTFPGNHGMWRAITSPALHTAFYLSIICWESLTMLVSWAAVVRLAAARTHGGDRFTQAKSTAVAALTMGLLLWLVAFLSVGGEWFLMWQSATWNGQEAAFRMFCVLGVVLLYMVTPYGE
jgi:predicted small integral membrane protein